MHWLVRRPLRFKDSTLADHLEPEPFNARNAASRVTHSAAAQPEREASNRTEKEPRAAPKRQVFGQVIKFNAHSRMIKLSSGRRTSEL